MAHRQRCQPLLMIPFAFAFAYNFKENLNIITDVYLV